MESPKESAVGVLTAAETAPVVLRSLPGTSPTKVSIEDVSFYYGKFCALKGITMEIPRNRVTAIIGPSGCGKTTLLRMLNRMYDLVPGSRAEGRIMLDGQDVVTTRNLLELRQRVGMVFQRPISFPMSIRDNVTFAPPTAARSGSDPGPGSAGAPSRLERRCRRRDPTRCPARGGRWDRWRRAHRG